MDLSLFLAKIFGPYLILICAAAFYRRKEFPGLIDKFIADTPLMLFSGALTLFIGLALVHLHNVWELNWRGMITLLCWMAVVKGLLRLFSPPVLKSFVDSLVKSSGMVIWLTVFFVIGVWLTAVGYRQMGIY